MLMERKTNAADVGVMEGFRWLGAEDAEVDGRNCGGYAEDAEDVEDAEGEAECCSASFSSP